MADMLAYSFGKPMSMLYANASTMVVIYMTSEHQGMLCAVAMPV
jgi:hypothetical protein